MDKKTMWAGAGARLTGSCLVLALASPATRAIVMTPMLKLL